MIVGSAAREGELRRPTASMPKDASFKAVRDEMLSSNMRHIRDTFPVRG
jgi:hypothetical protein